MKISLICSGFGGQGALTLGKFLAKASMHEGRHVTWLPSYGPEMRGGTANCSVILSDEEVASPVVGVPDVMVAFNQPSIDKFESSIAKDGVLIYNSDMCPGGATRNDIRVVGVPMNKIATEIGSMKVVNMVAIGVFVAVTKAVKFESIESDLTAFLQKKAPKLLELNLQAIAKGMEYA